MPESQEYPRVDRDITERVVDFLKESSEYYNTSVQARVDADRMYSGDFWTNELIKEWHRTRRRCEHLSQWPVFEAAISSPLSASPWHAQLEDQAANQEIQEAINSIEADSDAKNAFLNCFAKAVDIGANFIVVTTVADEWTGEPKIIPECVKDPTSVALDPTVTTASAKDAERGAVVNWISEHKAKRLYGKDVLPLAYPQSVPALYYIGDQWVNRPKKTIPIVTYYEKNDNGLVDMYKLCGDKVVEHVELPTTIVPIFRFAAYEVTKNRMTDYIGIVKKTYSLQLGLNIAYSTMLERANRNPKANWMMPVKAMDGLEEYYRRAQEDDSLAILYNGEAGVPTQLKEAFETGDLQNIINTTQQLMAAVLGIPPTGIQGAIGNPTVERSATEVLEQAANRESNVASLYAHAYEAMRAIWMCVIEMLNGGNRIKFSLQAGPDVITANMKRRQELQVIATLLPEPLKVILAKYYADTLSTDDAKALAKDIIANMDPSIKLVINQELDEYAIHEIKRIQLIANQAMDELESTKAENLDLKRQVDSLFTELANKREERQLSWNKALLDNQVDNTRLSIEAAKVQNQSEEAGQKMALESQKMAMEGQRIAMEAQDRMEQTISENDRILGGI